MTLRLNAAGEALVKRLLEEHLMDTGNNRSAAVANHVLADLKERTLTNRAEPSALIALGGRGALPGPEMARRLKLEFPWLGTADGDDVEYPDSGADVIEQLEDLYGVWRDMAHA